MPGKQGSVLVKVMRWTARILLILVILPWLVFCIVDGIGDMGQLGPMGFVMMLPVAVALLFCLWISWRAELLGGALLVAGAIFAYYAFDVGNPERLHGNPAVGYGLVLPAAVCGVLLIFTWLQARPALPLPAQGEPQRTA